MKQVANKDAILRINKESNWIEEADLSFEVNESDGYALEEALRIKEKVGGEVVVCSMGPQRAKSVIKDALARGADRAIHVVGDNISHLSPFAAASVLANAVRDEQADLIMTGLQSDDYGYGQTGVILAELLGLPHATIVIEIDATGEQLRVKRELESGWYQWYTMPKPALLTIQSGISQIRYATLKGIMAAKKKEIREVTPSAEIIGGPSHQLIEKIHGRRQTSKLPAILIATKNEITKQLRSMHDQVEDLIEKPFFTKEITRRIKRVVDKISLEKMAREAPGESVVRGNLQQMNTMDLFQSLELGHKTCRLTLTNASQRCDLYFNDGQINHARYGGLQGDEAVFKVLTWTEGLFEIDFSASSSEQTTTRSTQALLMEGLRLLDEASRDAEENVLDA